MKICPYCNKPIDKPIDNPKSNQRYHLDCSNIVHYRRNFFREHPAAARIKCHRCQQPIAKLDGHVVDPISLTAAELRFLAIGGQVSYDFKRHELHRCTPSVPSSKFKQESQ